MGTLTATVRATKPTVGGDQGPIWSNEINASFDLYDKAINQTIVVAATDANQTLLADGSPSDQATYSNIGITGTWTANRTVTLPSCQKTGWFYNGTTGGFSAVLTTGGGASQTIPNDGFWNFYNSDGTNITLPNVRFGALEVVGPATVSGALTVTNNITINRSSSLKASAGNASIAFSTNGMVVNLSNSGNAVFDFSDSQQAFAWGYGATTPMLLTGATGGLAITGTLTQGSDRRIKSDIKPINGLEALRWLRSTRPFEYEIGGSASGGFVAQEEIKAGFDRGIGTVSNPNLAAEADSPAGRQYVIDLEYRVALLTAAVKMILQKCGV